MSESSRSRGASAPERAPGARAGDERRKQERRQGDRRRGDRRSGAIPDWVVEEHSLRAIDWSRQPAPVQEVARGLIDLATVHGFYLAIIEDAVHHHLPLPDAIHRPVGRNEGERLRNALDGLRQWLSVLDLAIAAPMMRDALRTVASREIAEALLRYLVRKQSTADVDRDKLDFVVTYLYRLHHGMEEPNPPSFFNDEPSVFEEEVYAVLAHEDVQALAMQARELLREFRNIWLDVERLQRFDELTDSGIVQRVREIKQVFGPAIYHPRVMATIAEYNTLFGRRFDQLFHAAMEDIKGSADKVKNDADLAKDGVRADAVRQIISEKPAEILKSDYGKAQEQFRTIVRVKKVLDKKKSTQRGTPAQAAAGPRLVPDAGIRPADKNVEEGKLASMQESIRNYLRSTEPAAKAAVPLPHGNIALNRAEIEAFRTDYMGEKSFRAEYAASMTRGLAIQARMIGEIQQYESKQNFAHLWKPHAQSMAYLVEAAKETCADMKRLMDVSQQRGLQEKVINMKSVLERVVLQSGQVIKILERIPASASTFP